MSAAAPGASLPRGDVQPLVRAGIVLGIGLGGFVDGILFHQLLQLHNMMSARVPVRGVEAQTLAVNLEINMFWDGLFHAFTWCATAVGVALLWRALVQGRDGRAAPPLPVPTSGKAFAGSLALGWGLFNLVEGVIDHHLLELHHVAEAGDHLLWDLVFLASGGVLVVFGAKAIRRAQRELAPLRTA